MGAPKSASPPSYRDDPSLDDAVSLHTTPDQDAPDLESLPAYSDEVEGAALSAPGVTLNRYIIQPFKHQKGIDIIFDPKFDTDPLYAERTIHDWAQIPPNLQIRILGTHTQTTKRGDKEEKETVTDFDVKVRLSEYLTYGPLWRQMQTVENNERVHRGTIWRKALRGKHLEDGKSNLNEWCHRFCASHARLRSFRFTREVTGLDQRYLSDQITTLILNTNYKGHLKVTFPIENRAVEVYTSHRFNVWRFTTWIVILCYATFMWLFTWPYLFFATRRWSVVRCEWRYSVNNLDERVFAVASEIALFRRWAKTIENAVLDKKQCYFTEADLATENTVRPEFRSGNSSVDSAVGYIGTGIRAFNEVNRQLGWGGDC
ncbi:hypothetical protein EJ06DRAFT_480528 [Trichodelitschia bisporula]|uniref:Uncharacterized protein n=1 Tax=Trichodelitschia bisporula TaxID=703511 RepID=A0A6G1HRM4_9PEZI|nr:hypothetical protein EJ06DRAFT_480528 [Trichodelitschia bisporula]